MSDEWTYGYSANGEPARGATEGAVRGAKQYAEALRELADPMTLGTHDARVAALREALEFYGRRSTYVEHAHDARGIDGEPRIRSFLAPIEDDDYGKRARAALRADDGARGATPDPDAREKCEGCGCWVSGDDWTIWRDDEGAVLCALCQPASIRDLLGGGAS